MNFTLIVLAGVISLIPLLLFLFGNQSNNKTASLQNTDQPGTERSRTDSDGDEDEELNANDSERVELGSDFQLPYGTKQIIPDNSPYEIYQKTLEIAEIQGKSGNLESARELYQGLLERISSKEIRDKIQENIDYLDNYQLIANTRAKERRQKEKDIELSQNEIRVSMGGKDFLPENIKIDITPPRLEPQLSLDSAIDKISEKLSLLQPALSQSNAKLDELAQYKQDLDKLKDELHSLHNLKEEAVRARELKVQNELEELQKLRSEIERANAEKQKNDEIAELKNELQRLKNEQRPGSDSEIGMLRDQLTRVQSELLSERLRQAQAPFDVQSDKEQFDSRQNQEMELLRQQLKNAESHRREIVELQEHITRLTSELAKTTEKEGEINSLKEQISRLNERLERPVASESQLEAMKVEIRSLTEQLVISQTQQIESDAIRKELEKLKSDLTFTQSNDEFIDSLKSDMKQMQQKLHEADHNREEIDQLRKQLSDMQNTAANEGGSATQRDQSEQMRQQLQSEKEARNFAQNMARTMGESIEKMSDSLFIPPSQPEAYAPSKTGGVNEGSGSSAGHGSGETIDKGFSEETEQITRIEKKGEDKKEEFETLEDYMNGPQYELPSDDDILEKILTDELSKKKTDQNESEYDIKRPDQKDDESNFNEEFDISKLFEKPDNQRLEDEEFYAKFLEKTRPKVKKELPILDVHYKFEKIPESTVLSKEANVIEESFYKYKGMLDKANDFIKRRKVKDALNYYEVIMNQDIPEEFKKMIKRNIDDLNEYLDKYMLS